MKLYCNKNGHSYGVIGTPTQLTDKNGNRLCVGDVVILKAKGVKWSKMRFVAYDEEYNKFYIPGAYIDISRYELELAISHTSLTEGWNRKYVLHKIKLDFYLQ